METLFINLAYRYVALALMVAEANHAIQQLNVEAWRGVAPADLTTYFIAPPRRLLGGSLETTNFFFGFGDGGRLRYIHFYNNMPRNQSLSEHYERWAKLKSAIGTNEAYQLASNWLTRLEVDVPALEKVYPARVIQAYLADAPPRVDGLPLMVPRFEVGWGTNAFEPIIWVSVFGPTKEPLLIRMEDTSFSKRPKGLIKDAEKLLAIPNAEFASYSIIQKSNLVVESATAKYPSYSLPEVVKTKSTNELRRESISPAPPGAKGTTRLPQPKLKTVPPGRQPKSND